MQNTSSDREHGSRQSANLPVGEEIAVERRSFDGTSVISDVGPLVDPNFMVRFGRRLFDVLGAFAIFIATLPFTVVISIVIRLSGKPIIFSHERVGRDRKMFRCYKFRSMIPNAEEVLKDMLRSNPELMREWEENHKLREDPRVTRFGDFLRRSSLDELPQLWNVIKGDMSLVGPRPIVKDELKRYGNKASFYASVRPGMTGLWQIMGRSNVTYSRRVDLDMRYVRKKSIKLDIWILFKTLAVVVRRVGAH